MNLRVLLLFCGLCSAALAVEKPNIVFLLTDDQTIGALGCSGNPDVITPHLDKLASDGVHFQNHYDTTSICMASRCSVLTGLYEHRHGCNFDHGDLERRVFADSYPVKLRQAGYFTGFAGKIGFVIRGEAVEAFEREAEGSPRDSEGNSPRDRQFIKTANAHRTGRLREIRPSVLRKLLRLRQSCSQQGFETNCLSPASPVTA